MAQVDPEDDSIRRFIVRHYRYDSQRRERPGYLRRAANGHLLSHAIARGVSPPGLERLELPSNMSYVTAVRDESAGDADRRQ
jgi:hypothetical protein